MSPTNSTIYYPDCSLNILNSNGVKTCHIEPQEIKLSVNYVGCNTVIDASNVTIAYGDGSFSQQNNAFFQVTDEFANKTQLRKNMVSFFRTGLDVNDIMLDASDNLQMGNIKPIKIELTDETTILSSNTLQLGDEPLIISADIDGDLSLDSTERDPFDCQLQKYLPITVNGTKYWMPLFVDFP